MGSQSTRHAWEEVSCCPEEVEKKKIDPTAGGAERKE